MSDLRDRLLDSLIGICNLPCINAFAEFTQGELHILHFLATHRNEEIHPSHLSDVLHVSRARITSALRSLRKKSYICMSLCENDRRRMRVELTDTGKEYLDAKQQRVIAYLQEWISGMGEENTEQMIELLRISATVMADKE